MILFLFQGSSEHIFETFGGGESNGLHSSAILSVGVE